MEGDRPFLVADGAGDQNGGKGGQLRVAGTADDLIAPHAGRFQRADQGGAVLADERGHGDASGGAGKSSTLFLL